MSSEQDQPQKEFDLRALARCAGKDDGPVYIAYGGRVIDVTASRLWKGGLHMNRHPAGKDLTADIRAAPHGLEVLDRFPQVGVLAPAPKAAEWEPPPALARLLLRFPSLRRHPHPMTVHFPIAFAVAALAFSALRLLTGVESFGSTAFHCLMALALSTPPAAVTGLLTWRLNYGGRAMGPVTIKRRLAAWLVAGSVAGSAWQLFGTDVHAPVRPATIFYLVLLASLALSAGIAGSLGGNLSFPLRPDEPGGGKDYTTPGPG